ncbi:MULTISPECIES: L-threonylcarbamoyladenylate synthase [Legionella]|uniref:Threonylcarbamoyl-AMP synthase n=1 Tax=Legionella septentrionalis TaxID=2498109 RepID=A0A433JKW6_9GAMM|nr:MULTISPECIES: L-threonylcarbamoyladenylate synthase [Legionella]MCP0913497.1 L-threonylcarbamoyladenylate synthase [Legionella sp. 27cVA30]RUQ89727.1 threonylcarbamoyl-AMP synthase [Legionella septentrionalis]RUQ99728.1 threonylcarbamoyl-AMP synthase [Legionella septentrionalis]RUR11078.1 threonylcarbamoyl-AMP synthase [Legionella septentrionalis]RUR15240.1 threonylcarbamoyl-AMP synthase [Legionella septentrionalis]
MSQFFAIHPDNPQSRLIRQAVGVIEEGGLIVYPTDSGYALGCALGNKSALDRIRDLRQLDKNHNMTLVCRDLSQIGTYARVSNPIFRLLKAFTPGPYTFILNATREVPRRMLHPKRKTLGLRIPENTITLALLESLDAPLMSTTLILPGAKAPLSEPESIRDVLGNQIDLIIDGGNCDQQPTTVVDLTGDFPAILREGRGDPTPFK